jgi:carbonic anhydrase/acetyltransferase-like protein (isoleucine patch superfamily)
VNVQEGAVLHCDTAKPLTIEDDVTIGHGAVVHCRSVGQGSLIGIKAVVLGDVIIGKNCLVAAGAVVSPGTVVPDGQVVMGIPAKTVRPIRDSELEYLRANNRHYVELARQHAEHPEQIYRAAASP